MEEHELIKLLDMVGAFLMAWGKIDGREYLERQKFNPALGV